MIGNLPYIVVALLFGIGIFTLLFKRNLIKIAMGISIIASGVNLFLVSLGYRAGGVAAIFTSAPVESANAVTQMVLPAPQALTLTSIVIGLAATALMLSLAVFIFKHYGSLDSGNARRLRE